MQELIEKLAICVEKGKISRSHPFPPDMKDQDGADEIAAQALKEGIPPDTLLQACMLGMEHIGKQFSQNLVFVPHLLVAAQAMNTVLKHLQPYLESGSVKRKGKFLIGTVAGDLHDIGKNLVSMIIRGGGFEVIDLGVDVSTQKFLSGIEQHRDCFVGLSALLTTTLPNMQKSVSAIRESYPELKIMIGGAPVTEDFRAQIGADFYSHNPQDAVEYLNRMVV
ncbi:MAG: corrinoid protein [Candidatus Neomarinimicrobiota bacterium]